MEVGLGKAVLFPSLGKVGLHIVAYILSEYCQLHASFFYLLFPFWSMKHKIKILNYGIIGL